MIVALFLNYFEDIKKVSLKFETSARVRGLKFQEYNLNDNGKIKPKTKDDLSWFSSVLSGIKINLPKTGGS